MKEKSFGTLAILGTGLMGGSFGLACRRHGLFDKINGFDLLDVRLEMALERGAVTEATTSAIGAVAGASLVVIATPVGVISEVFSEVAASLEDAAVVTDLGSTKERVVTQILRTPGGERFVGGHPIAGGEQEGIEAATADLFDGCSWILTPTEKTDGEAYGRLVRIIGRLGARVLALEPQRHDELMALTSHLPQILSSALMAFAADSVSSEQGLPMVSAGGFRDMTRIAGSSPTLWVDILKDNRKAIGSVIRRFEDAVEAIRNDLESENWEAIVTFLSEARSARSHLPGKPGAPVRMIEMLIPVPDRPGVLAEITTTVGGIGVNIEDIDIVHSQEGGRGTIHLMVGGEESAERAAKAIEAKGYRVSLGDPA